MGYGSRSTSSSVPNDNYAPPATVNGARKKYGGQKGETMKTYVRIRENERHVTCPICHTQIDLENVSETACQHLGREDYITPRGPFEPGYDVWFVVPEDINPFDVLRALVREDARSWGGSPHIVLTGGEYLFASDGMFLDGVPVPEHPGYVGMLADVLGEDVLALLEEIRFLLWERMGAKK